VFEVARGAIKVNVSDRLREALERLDQAIDRLDATAVIVPAGPAGVVDGTSSVNTAAIAAKLDRMIQRVEAALVD
jgi:hypothetical protein